VWSGERLHAANISGGLHHAMPDRASGFCIYNDVAVAIRWLLDQGAERVAYVDVDVHHGDGVERVFYDDPRVLTVSLHETGQMLFPGTGFPKDTGGPGAEGCRRARPTPAGCGPSMRWCRRCCASSLPTSW
jgi:acetoin utilization protein AcuC